MAKPTTEHSLLASSLNRTFQLKAQHLSMFVKQQYTELAQSCVEGNNDSRGALLVLMATARNPELVEAADKAGFLLKVGGQIGQETYLYLWAHAHDDFMWLLNHKEEWQRSLTGGMPWKIVLAERFHKPEWNDSLAQLLANWEPTRMNKYPHALKYMRNPTERHVLEAACGKEGSYMKAEQIDAMRPGASVWFKVRKELGIEETTAQAKYAFRAWWKQGAVQQLDGLDGSLFSNETP